MKIRVTQYTLSTYTHQFRYWDGDTFLGMKEVFLGSVTIYKA